MLTVLAQTFMTATRMDGAAPAEPPVEGRPPLRRRASADERAAVAPPPSEWRARATPLGRD